ncbi:MAG TPA: ACT domain-containing protein, partial [Acidimicrobiales bacterium]
IADAGDDGRIAVRVHPAMVPVGHPLAAVRDSFNAVFIEGDAVGSLMLLGRGAGGRPTASAVLGDLVDAAANLRSGAHASLGALRPAELRPVDELAGEYYVNLQVLDRPGVLRKVAEVFERHGVSIRSMEQEGLGDEARLILITHTAVERDLQAVLSDLRHLDVVDRVGTMLRVVGG